MRSLTFTAGLVLALAIDSAAYLLIPHELFNTAASLSLALVSLGIISFFYISGTKYKNAGDTIPIALLGPQNLANLLFTAGAMLAFVCGLSAYSSLSYALMVLICGCYTACQFIFKASADKLIQVNSGDRGSNQNLLLSQKLWQLQSGLMQESDIKLIDQLINDIKYGSSPSPDVTRNIDLKIDTIINEIANGESEKPVSSSKLAQLGLLIKEREQTLRNYRRRA